MTKYSTGDSEERTTQWHSDRRYVLAEWTTKPFVGINHRYDTVEHRLVVEYHHGVGSDFRHEVRSDDDCKAPEEWLAVEWFEVRDYGIRHHRRTDGGWWE